MAEVEDDQEWDAHRVEVATDNSNSGTVAAVCNEVAGQGIIFTAVDRAMVIAAAPE